MGHRNAFLLETIVEYCDKIAGYLRAYSVDRNAFLENPYYQDTCAFYCLQIGEYAGDLSEVFRASHNEINWRAIINLRNIIAHAYGTIDAKILWDILDKEIKPLRDFCAGFI